MNLLDENVREDRRSLLRAWGVPVQQMGSDVGRNGMKDEEVVPLLHRLRDVTFFTRDLGFVDPKLCHPRYCLVCLDVRKDEVAVFARRFLRHPEFSTRAKRMGVVVRVSHAGISAYRRNDPREQRVGW